MDTLAKEKKEAFMLLWKNKVSALMREEVVRAIEDEQNPHYKQAMIDQAVDLYLKNYMTQSDGFKEGPILPDYIDLNPPRYLDDDPEKEK